MHLLTQYLYKCCNLFVPMIFNFVYKFIFIVIITHFSSFSSSFKTKSRLFGSDDYNMGPSSRLTRSRSLTRLNGSVDEELSPPNSPLMFVPQEKSARHLRVTLDESENRRSVLMNKLKEAQETLTVS